jgi:hypothetical protein
MNSEQIKDSKFTLHTKAESIERTNEYTYNLNIIRTDTGLYGHCDFMSHYLSRIRSFESVIISFVREK